MNCGWERWEMDLSMSMWRSDVYCESCCEYGVCRKRECVERGLVWKGFLKRERSDMEKGFEVERGIIWTGGFWERGVWKEKEGVWKKRGGHYVPLQCTLKLNPEARHHLEGQG
jgi:hypothetical protein